MRPRPLAVTILTVLATLLPTASAGASVPEGAIAVEGGGYAQPLSAPTPDWYTPELHERVVAAGRGGVPLPDDVEVPASALAFAGIRPGSWMLFPSWCTLNFVFGSRSSPYIGTAGHCGERGDDVTIVAAPGVLMHIGSVVKSVDRGVGNDFALIRIRSGMADLVNPSMAVVAGPTGTGAPSFGQAVVHVGHGVAIGTGGTPRAGAVTYVGGSDYGWDGAASPGDSGSGVRAATGAAVGNLTHLVVGTKYLPAYIAGTTAERMETIAGKPIVTASLVPDPLP